MKCVSVKSEDAFESVVDDDDDDDDEGSETGFLLYDLNNANIPPEARDSLGAGSAIRTGLDADVEVEVEAVLTVSETASTVDGFLRRRSTYANFAKSGLAFFTKNMRAAVSR